ncbi:glycoside hydrolase family 43 protein [soil metagenome]
MSRPANPLLRGFYPDPSICRVDGTYYLVNSTFEYLPGIPIHTSTDLVDWRLVGHAIHDAAQFDFAGVPDSGGMFAPTIRHHDGLFYVACTQMDAGEVSGNFYVTAPDATGPWSRPVLLPDARGIDPSLFFHEGRTWWTGCREVLDAEFEGETEVWLRELDLERGELVGPETVIWTRTQYRAVWAEGPHLYHRNGWFYLLTAEGGTSFEHSVMVARSRDIAGPYLPCPRNPVLTHRHLGHGAEVQNVGHGDLVEDGDGQWWMTVLASRPINGHHVLGRETHLARVDWEDDWPVVNPGLGLLDAPVAAAGSWGSSGVPDAADFLTVRGFATFASAEESGLRMAPGALLRRLTSTDCTVTVTLEIPEGSVAGLVLRQSDAASVRFEVEASVEGLVVRLGDATVHLPAGSVTLAARVTPGGISWSAGEAALGETPLSDLSTETAGGFVGTTWGPYVASGNVLFTAWSQADRS